MVRGSTQPRHDNGRFGFDADRFAFGFDADCFGFDAPTYDNDHNRAVRFKTKSPCGTAEPSGWYFVLEGLFMCFGVFMYFGVFRCCRISRRRVRA